MIIPAHNEESTIKEAIKPLLSQKYSGKIETIVIDDKSSDKTGEAARSFKGVKVYRNKKNLGLSGSINKGVSLSRHDTVCILHADCVVSSKLWIRDMVKTLYSSDDVICSTSPIITPLEVWETYGFWQKVYSLRGFLREQKHSQDKIMEVEHITGDKCDMFRKQWLQRIGGFDSETYRVAGEDADLSNRIKKAGYRILRIPTPVTHMHGAKPFGPSYTWRKALQLSEASGVLYKKFGFKHGKYWNEMTKSICYISLLIPFVNIVAAAIIAAEIGFFTYQAAVNIKDIKVVFVPFNKFITDIMNVVGFLRGWLTGKQVT